VRFAGPLLPPAADPQTELPPWWPELTEAGRVVHITQGTVATDPATLTRPALEALAGLDALVVVTTPDPEGLGPVPANARVARFVPHSLLLPHVDAVVTNGGFNGVKAALAHGVPLVVAPWGNDQPDVAARVAWAGAGVNLRRRTPAVRDIGAAVRAVLSDARYGHAARRLQAEFRRYPGGEHAADHLEALCASPAAPTGAAAEHAEPGVRGTPPAAAR
jgi:MGT family glycosyltransferase